MPDIDRIAPTQRPNRHPVMRQTWRKLLFLHWPLPPEVLLPFIPRGLELDIFDGQAYVGLVPFTMANVRPVGIPPVRGISNFHETNVRTYVHREGRDPGVWFFSLDAANSLAVLLARRLFHLPYHRARMFVEREHCARSLNVSPLLYAGVRLWPDPVPASWLIRAQATGEARPSAPGTLEHFLAERYLLYAKSHERLFQGQVHHTPYPLQAAKLLSIDENLLAASGIDRPHSAPLAHYAESVSVEVFALTDVGVSTSSEH